MAKSDKSDAKAQKNVKELSKIKEPTILIRPITRLGGLDNIHVALIALIVILIALLLLISYSKPFIVRNATVENCTYGAVNNSCLIPEHNASQIKAVAEQLLATYAVTNSSLSLLPYYSNVSKMQIYYVPGLKSWYISVPYTDPQTNQTLNFAALINDNYTTVITPYYQIPRPSLLSNNKVVTTGVIQVAGKPYCSTQSPLQVYWFIDPYATGALRSLTTMTALSGEYGSKTNFTIKVLYGPATQQVSDQVGQIDADALGQYLVCGSKQQGFSNYVAAVNSIYNNGYLSPNTLVSVAQNAGLNVTQLNNCVSTIGGEINSQALLADYYNISYTPSLVTNCEYLSIPQTANQAICYANSTLC